MAVTLDQEIEANLSDESRVVLLNLLHDQRISPRRKGELDKTLPRFAGRVAPLLPEAHEVAYRVQRVVRDYYRKRVAVSADPDYSSPVLNGLNFVQWAKPGSGSGMHPDRKLVHVIDLAKYAKAFQQARLTGVPGTGASQQQVIDWLTAHVPAFPATTVPGRTDAEVEDFVDQALEVVHRYDSATRTGPTWVALWDQFQRHVRHGPNMWLRILGMADVYQSAPRYPMVLVYPPDEAGTLIRPTQLDAGFNSLHFPSPPSAPVAAGGFSMDRSPMPGSGGPLSEYLHDLRRDSVADWVLGGRAAGPTNVGANATALPDARRRHYASLRLKYPATPREWMRDVTCLA